MLDMLNLPGRSQEARLRYNSADYAILTPGTHVTCAITGEAIALDDLKYWSFERQEPYAHAAASLEAERRARGDGSL